MSADDDKPPPSSPPKPHPGPPHGSLTGPKKLEDRVDRLNAVEGLLASGLSRPRVVAELAKRWDLKERQVWNYVKAVEDRWAKEARKTRPAARNLLRARFEEIATRAMSARKFHAALAATREIGKLDGLYAPDRVLVDIKSMSVKDAIEELNETTELLALARARGLISENDDGKPVH